MYYNNQLYHHGILGQKWGKRNGPPYPLGSSQKSSSEKKRSRVQRAVRISDRKRARIEQKEIKKFNKNISKKWTDSYNKATDEFNSKIKELNKKYEGKDLSYPYNTPDKRKYINDVSNLWTSLYSDALIRDFGSHPSTDVGFSWIENMPLMNQYLDLLEGEDAARYKKGR